MFDDVETGSPAVVLPHLGERAAVLPFKRPEGSTGFAPPEEPPVFSEPVRALVAAVAAVADQQAVELSAAQALADATVLVRQLEALHAVVLQRVADVDTRKLHVLAGAPSTATWVARQQTSLDRGAVALARRLGGLPLVAEGLGSQTLSVENSRRLAAALGQLRRHVDRPDGLIDGQPAGQTLRAVVVDGVLSCIGEGRGALADDDPRLRGLLSRLAEIAARPACELSRLEASFVVLAVEVEPALLPSALARLVDALLPNELEGKSSNAHDARGFGLRRKADGSGWTITDGELDLECGELLHTVLTAELAVDEDNPADTAGYAEARAQGWEPGEELPACAGPRSLRQRRHDALRNGVAALPRREHRWASWQASTAHRRDRRTRRAGRRPRCPRAGRGVGGVAAVQPGPPLVVRQCGHALRPWSRTQGDRGQPHRADPQAP